MNIPAKVFISYSHKDEKYKDRLITHLSPLKELKLVKEWHDRMLVPGSVLHDEIDKNLSNSDIILLLISADYVSSYSCYKDEFPKAFNQWENGTALIVPIIVRETALWTNLLFGKFTALPLDAIPISSYKNKDKAYVNITKGLKKLIEEKIEDKEVKANCRLIEDEEMKASCRHIQCPKCGSQDIKMEITDVMEQMGQNKIEHFVGTTTMKLFSTRLFGFFDDDATKALEYLYKKRPLFTCNKCKNVFTMK